MKLRRVLLLMVLLLAGGYGVLRVRYAHRLAQDTFNEQLVALAGSNAVCCSSARHPNGPSPEVERAMVAAFADGEAFWAREERHYMNIHNNSQQWDVSEGFVFTSHGEMFQLDRHPGTLPTG